MASNVIDIKTFSQSGLNTDSDLLAIQGGDSRYRLNVILSEDGNYDVLSNLKGNVLRPYTLPAGTNIIKGFVEDEENKAGIYFIHNSNNDHAIIRYNSSDNSFTEILVNQSVILPGYPWTGFVDAGIIGNEEDQFLVWADGDFLKMINIDYAIANNYNPIITEEEISFYKKPILNIYNSITTSYETFIPRAPNRNLTGKMFQFAGRLIYFDKTVSTLSNYSEISFPVENMPNGRLSNDISYDVIRVSMDIQNEPSIVDAYQLLYRIVDIGGGNPGSWYIYKEYNYTSKGVKTLGFLNDQSIGIISDAEAARPYDYVPEKSSHIGIIDSNRIVTDITQEGFDNVSLSVTTSVVETAIIAGDEGNAFFDTGSVSVGTPLVFSFDPSTGNDYNFSLLIAGQGSYSLNTFGLVGLDIYTELKAWVDGLSLAGLSVVVTSTSMTFTATGSAYILTLLVLESCPYFRTLKSGASYKFGIEYGYGGKRGTIQTNDNCVLVATDFNDVSSTFSNYILDGQITINHSAPAGATDFRIVSFGSDINYFEEYLVYFDWNDITNSSSNYTIYLEEPYTIIKKVEMINRMRKAYGDETTSIDYGFDFQKGDIIRFVGYFDETSLITKVLYDVRLIDSSDYFIDDVNATEIRLSSSAIREILSKSPTAADRFWLIQIIRKNENFSSLAQEFSPSYPIIAHGGTISITNYFTDIWKSKQIFIGDNNGLDYGLPATYIYSWMEKPKVSLYYDSWLLSQGRVNIVSEFSEQRSDRRIRWGGKFIDDAGVNFLTKFDFDDNRELDDRNGLVTKIQQIGDVLKVYQERKVTSFYLKTTSSTNADGSSTYVFDDAVMSDGRQSIEDLGCTHFSSYQKNIRNAYFFDIVNGVVVRDSANGLQTISDNLMHTYFKQKSRDIVSSLNTFNIFGGWDEDLDMYLLTFVNLANLSDPLNATLGFHEPSNRWISFYSFLPEYYGKISGDQLLSFRAGALYEHNINPVRNNYFGAQYYSEVWLHSTEQAIFNKIFNSIEINSINQWSCPDYDSIKIERPIVMQSRLVAGKFQLQEGIYRADFLRDVLNGGSTPTRHNLLNGRQLRGKEITIKLKNTNTDQTLLESVIINSSISQ